MVAMVARANFWLPECYELVHTNKCTETCTYKRCYTKLKTHSVQTNIYICIYIYTYIDYTYIYIYI